MRQKQHTGLQISRPVKRVSSADWTVPVLSFGVLYALMQLTGMAEPWLPALAGAAVCGVSLLIGNRKWFYSGLLAVLLIFLLVLRDRYLDGFCQWYNGAGRVYTAESGMAVPSLEASADTRNLRVFAFWLAAAIALGFLLLRRLGREAVCTAALLICCGVSAALGRMIDLLPLLLAVVILGAGRGWKHQLLPAGILAFAVLLSGLTGISGWAEARSEEVRHAVHTQRYETKYTTLPEGRLESLGQSEATAMIVTMEKPEVLYLRGFTGAEFRDERWQPLDAQIPTENQELLYWLNSREFDLHAQFEAAASTLETRKNTVVIQNVGACSAWRYIPFTICGDDSLVPENLTDTASGGRYDSFTTVYGGADILSEVLTALQSESSRYRQAEAAYREYVRDHYLTIPEDLAEKMQPYWEKAEDMEAQEAVKAVLADCYPDGIRHDPWYATAAVLTLRHFGIPARYAEGYITPQTTATTVELTGRHAACWAEVYHDGIGWIPMALTTGQDGERSQQEQKPLPPDTPEETLPPETEPTTEPEPDGGYQVRIVQTLLNGLLVLLLGALLLILLLLLRRKHCLKKRQTILDQEDVREAVMWSFADSIRALERMGFHRGNGSLDALVPPLRDRFGSEFTERFEAASRINARALFSGKPMTQTERETVHGFRLCVLECLQANSGRLSRLWMKYILCFY